MWRMFCAACDYRQIVTHVRRRPSASLLEDPPRSIASACKQIASLVNRAGLSDLTGVAGVQNVQGAMGPTTVL